MSRLPRYLALLWAGMSSSVLIQKMMYMFIWKHGHKEVDFFLLQMVNLHVLDGISRLYLHKQQNRYGLRGYVSAYILPDGFIPLCSGVEIVSQKETEYASITIRNPFERAFAYIPNAYKKFMKYLNANGCRQNLSDEYVCCFEYVYQKDEMTYITVCVAVDALARANLITPIR